MAFDRTLAKKIQEFGIKCWVVCKYNWFGSNKIAGNYWSGLYECYSCKLKFKCSIESVLPNRNVQVLVKWSGEITHDKVEPNSRLRIEGSNRNIIYIKWLS